MLLYYTKKQICIEYMVEYHNVQKHISTIYELYILHIDTLIKGY